MRPGALSTRSKSSMASPRVEEEPKKCRMVSMMSSTRFEDLYLARAFFSHSASAVSASGMVMVVLPSFSSF
jgi:hypothetical protein